MYTVSSIYIVFITHGYINAALIDYSCTEHLQPSSWSPARNVEPSRGNSASHVISFTCQPHCGLTRLPHLLYTVHIRSCSNVHRKAATTYSMSSHSIPTDFPPAKRIKLGTKAIVLETLHQWCREMAWARNNNNNFAAMAWWPPTSDELQTLPIALSRRELYETTLTQEYEAAAPLCADLQFCVDRAAATLLCLEAFGLQDPRVVAFRAPCQIFFQANAKYDTHLKVVRYFSLDLLRSPNDIKILFAIDWRRLEPKNNYQDLHRFYPQSALILVTKDLV